MHSTPVLLVVKSAADGDTVGSRFRDVALTNNEETENTDTDQNSYKATGDTKSEQESERKERLFGPMGWIVALMVGGTAGFYVSKEDRLKISG